jgi:hypothetical protein
MYSTGTIFMYLNLNNYDKKGKIQVKITNYRYLIPLKKLAVAVPVLVGRSEVQNGCGYVNVVCWRELWYRYGDRWRHFRQVTLHAPSQPATVPTASSGAQLIKDKCVETVRAKNRGKVFTKIIVKFHQKLQGGWKGCGCLEVENIPVPVSFGKEIRCCICSEPDQDFPI